MLRCPRCGDSAMICDGPAFCEDAGTALDIGYQAGIEYVRNREVPFEVDDHGFWLVPEIENTEAASLYPPAYGDTRQHQYYDGFRMGFDYECCRRWGGVPIYDHGD